MHLNFEPKFTKINSQTNNSIGKKPSQLIFTMSFRNFELQLARKTILIIRKFIAGKIKILINKISSIDSNRSNQRQLQIQLETN